MTKAELRKQFLEKRHELSANDIDRMSRAIADRFFREIDLSATKTFSTFIRIAKFNEIDTSAIYYRIWKEKPWIRTFAPKIDRQTGTMATVALFPDTPLVENTWGVREPVEGETIDTAAIDLVIVPLLAVDRVGHRVGYGKGFYDRFLKACRTDCMKVGVNYFAPLERMVDVGEHDIALDVCVTPNEVVRF